MCSVNEHAEEPRVEWEPAVYREWWFNAMTTVRELRDEIDSINGGRYEAHCALREIVTACDTYAGAYARTVIREIAAKALA